MYSFNLIESERMFASARMRTMPNPWRRQPKKLKGAILDFSGTTVDPYVIAPAQVFCDVFKKHGVPISMKEAREPMGLRKDLHIAEILKQPSVEERWTVAKNKAPTPEDAAALFVDFVPMQIACLSQYSGVIPGAVEAVNTLRLEHHMKIGATTGFTKAMTKVLQTDAAQQGLFFDSVVAGDEVKHGARPMPFMLYENLERLGVWPIENVVKVDDVPGGIGEGRNAGCWTVGVSRYSNAMNVDSYDHEAQLSKVDLAERNRHARQVLSKAGAHYVVDTIRELPKVVNHINTRLLKGEMP